MEGEIIFNIDVMLAKRKMSVTELSQRVGITMAKICWNIEIALAIMEKI